MTGSVLIDRIVFGTIDLAVKKWLLREIDLKIENAITIARAAESSNEQLKVIQNQDIREPKVDASVNKFKTQKSQKTRLNLRLHRILKQVHAATVEDTK